MALVSLSRISLVSGSLTLGPASDEAVLTSPPNSVGKRMPPLNLDELKRIAIERALDETGGIRQERQVCWGFRHSRLTERSVRSTSIAVARRSGCPRAAWSQRDCAPVIGVGQCPPPLRADPMLLKSPPSPPPELSAWVVPFSKSA